MTFLRYEPVFVLELPGFVCGYAEVSAEVFVSLRGNKVFPASLSKILICN
jgi:hypothetical protein